MSSNFHTPEVSKTSVLLGLSHSLKIFSEEGIKLIGNELTPGAVSWVMLSVQEPLWDVVLEWSGKDVVDLSDLLFVDFTGSLVEVDLGNLHGKEGKSSSNTSDLSETEWSLLFTVDVCVLNSKNMLKFVWILQNQ